MTYYVEAHQESPYAEYCKSIEALDNAQALLDAEKWAQKLKLIDLRVYDAKRRRVKPTK